MTSRISGALRTIAIGAIVIYLLAPTLVVVVFSVYPSAYITFPPHSFTLKWYRLALAQNDLFLNPLVTSVVLGLSSAALATVFGTLAAIGLERSPLRHRYLWQGVFLAPILIPTLIVGFGLMLVFLKLDVLGSWWGLVAGHVTIVVAYVTQSVSASLAGLDPSIEEAARTLGSGRLRAFFRTTLPQIAPGILAGTVFAFIMSFDELAVTLLLATPRTTTLPVAIYSYVQFDSGPTVAAIATVLLGLTLGLLMLLQRVGGLRRRAY
jgi:putative spermidine/putrescine transport system permease protein